MVDVFFFERAARHATPLPPPLQAPSNPPHSLPNFAKPRLLYGFLTGGPTYLSGINPLHNDLVIYSFLSLDELSFRSRDPHTHADLTLRLFSLHFAGTPQLAIITTTSASLSLHLSSHLSFPVSPIQRSL